MAIRFRCGQCSQPIEVDDPLAGKLARCPYCTAVVTVPAESTLIDEPIATARPASNLPPLPPMGGSGPPPLPTTDPRAAGPRYAGPTEYDASARAALALRGTRMGNFALVCASLVVTLLVAWMVLSTIKVYPKLQAEIKKRSTPPDFKEMMEIVEAAAGNDPIFTALAIGSMFFSICGVAFAAASLRATGAENWRAWVALAICGPFVVCNCCLGPALMTR